MALPLGAIVTRPEGARGIHIYKPPLPLQEPSGLWMAYMRALRAEHAFMAREVMAIWDRYSNALKLAMEVDRSDSGGQRADMTGNILQAIIDTIKEAMKRRFTDLFARELGAKMVNGVVDFHGKQQGRQLLRSLGVQVQVAEPWLPEFVDQAVRANVQLIKTIPSLDRVETVVRQGVRQGQRVQVMRKSLVETFGASKARADLIARDQTLKAYSQVNTERHKNLGVKRCTWRVIGDGRTRATHLAMAGVVYDIDQPPLIRPKTGERLRPGQDYQCRCQEEPRLEDLVPGIPTVKFPEPRQTTAPKSKKRARKRAKPKDAVRPTPRP